MDVEFAFLNGYISKDIFIEQVEGFVVQGSEDKVYKLINALYGLKQTLRARCERIDS